MWARRDFISATAALAAGAIAGCRPDSLLGPPVASAPRNQSEPEDDQRREEENVSENGDRPLRQIAAEKGLFFGSALHLGDLLAAPGYEALFAEQCGMLVPEVEMKFTPLRPGPEEFAFDRADALVQIAERYGMNARGHTLVWHKPSALPNWLLNLANPANAEAILVDHIETVVGRYRGQLHSWDVVNEAIDVDSPREDKLRVTPWLEWMGPEYIDIAFRAAAAADDEATLVYNDYGLDYDTPTEDMRRTATLRLLEGMIERGVPIHGLGIQAHLNAAETRFDERILRAFLNEVSQLGLVIVITEMDVNDYWLTGDPQARDERVAGCYRQYLDIALDNPATRGVITWGLSDQFSWLRASRADGTDTRPLPFDLRFERKPAWSAIATALDGATERRG